jgi:hypothetical protein
MNLKTAVMVTIASANVGILILLAIAVYMLFFKTYPY